MMICENSLDLREVVKGFEGYRRFVGLEILKFSKFWVPEFSSLEHSSPRLFGTFVSNIFGIFVSSGIFVTKEINGIFVSEIFVSARNFRLQRKNRAIPETLSKLDQSLWFWCHSIQLDELFRMRYYLYKLFLLQNYDPMVFQYSGVCISVQARRI